MDGFESLLGAAVEGAIVSGDSKSKSGCLFFFILIVLIIGGGVWYYSYTASDANPPKYIKGVVDKKLSNNYVDVRTDSGVINVEITPELYDQKRENDSIYLKVKN